MYIDVLLIITAVTGATGESVDINFGVAGRKLSPVHDLNRRAAYIQHKRNKRLTAMVGDNFVLTCSHKSNIKMLVWNISPEVGGPCTLGYRADNNPTHTNCTDSVNWKFRPNQHPALETGQVGTAHEGNYTCETVATEGNFVATYYLTVLAPPTLTLFCDDHGNPVCKAVAGKPAAHLSWVPGGNFTLAQEGHDNGTVTVVSELTANSANRTNTTCVLSHPAGTQSKSIACHPSKIIMRYLHCIITFASLLGLLFLLGVLHLYTFCDSSLSCSKEAREERANAEVQEDNEKLVQAKESSIVRAVWAYF
ncbi:cell surface glycoprotein CD200 receptor 1-B-like [Porphyrio hochstetteri]